MSAEIMTIHGYDVVRKSNIGIEGHEAVRICPVCGGEDILHDDSSCQFTKFIDIKYLENGTAYMPKTDSVVRGR